MCTKSDYKQARVETNAGSGGSTAVCVRADDGRRFMRVVETDARRWKCAGFCSRFVTGDSSAGEV